MILKILKTEMNNSSTLNIKKELYNDIELYCKTNDITDVELFCNQLLEKGFNIEKYGTAPAFISVVEKNIEKKSEPIVTDTENIVSLPTENQDTKETHRKNYKKANINDDYKVYDY